MERKIHMNLRKEIEEFQPIDAQEIQDKITFLKWMDTYDNLLIRENSFCHFSSTALVLNKEKDKMLVVYHKINDGWIYPGGHADGEENLLNVAIREVEEETGQTASILSSSIFAIQIFPVKGHMKNGKYVSAHTHLDVIYLLEANDKQELSFRKEESNGVKWTSLKNIEEDMVDFAKPIHKKLIKKLTQKGYI